MQVQIAPQLRMVHTTAPEQRGGVQRTRSQHYALRMNADARRALLHQHARGAPVLQQHALRSCIHQHARTGVLRAPDVRAQAALLGSAAAAKQAIAARLAAAGLQAAVSVACNQLHRITEGLRAIPQRLILKIMRRLIRAHMPGLRHRIQAALKFGCGEVRHLVRACPLLQNVIRRAKGARPINGGAAAQAAAREQSNAAVAGGERRTLLIQARQHFCLALRELGLGHVRAFFHNDDIVAGFCQLCSHHRTARAAAHHHCVTMQHAVCGAAQHVQRAQRCHWLRQRAAIAHVCPVGVGDRSCITVVNEGN